MRHASRLLWLAAPALLFAPPAVADGPEDEAGPVEVRVDTSEVPELDDWGAEAGRLIETWHPKIAAMLASEGSTPPTRVDLRFKRDAKGVAWTSGNKITVAADWVKQHPDDYGMIVHELVHVIQSYPRGAPGWLTEGIADKIRFIDYEHGEGLRRPARRSSYRDSYRTSARFLAWIEEQYDPRIVATLNRALREHSYRSELFRESTGKPLDELWEQYVAASRDADSEPKSESSPSASTP